MNNRFFLVVISLDVKSWNQTVTALCLKLSVIVGNQSGKITIIKNHYLQTPHRCCPVRQLPMQSNSNI